MNQQRGNGPLVILALDAGDAGLIERWTDEGHLQTIKGLLARGVQSRLTGPELVSENGIWVSLFSGLSCAQHGYYYWRPLKPGTYELELSNQQVDGAVPFWGHSRQTGMRVAVVDVPETHCTVGVPGIQVANWAPHNARFAGYSVPASLFADLRSRFGSPLGVEERVGSTLDEDVQIYGGLLKQIEQKAAICDHLLSRDKFDLVVLGFHESHIAGHQFWKYSDRSSAPVNSRGRLTHATRDVYQAIDRVFGDLLERLPQDSTAAVVSNMGLQEDYPNLELTQAFCRQLGYHRMRPRVDSRPAIPRLARRMIPQSWQRTISSMLPDAFHAQMLSREWLGGTDWSATTVFPIPSYFLGFLRVNLRGREPQGVVEPGSDYLQLLERVEADLMRLTDPISGRPAVRYIARTVDHFHTEPHESLPDIFFDWAPAPYPKRRVEHPHTVLEQTDMFFNRDTRHDLCGFFAAAGPGITGRGRIHNLSVLDVAPTCLRLMGRMVPDSMQGTAASEILA
jgi:predicted AlkP superfamily phosphohydrolase/phosphomutase